MLKSNRFSITFTKKELFFALYLFVVIGIHRYFSVQGALLFVGGIIGFFIPYLESWIDSIVPKSVGAQTLSKHSMFKSPEVLIAYIVFSFAFLVTNRSLFANGAVLGFGGKIVLDGLFLLNNLDALKREFFWKFALNNVQMKNMVYIFTFVFVILTLLA